MPKNSKIIRHADLSKMNDEALFQELVYMEGHADKIGWEINRRIKKMLNNVYPGPKIIGTQPEIPIWKLHEDHSSATDRIRAIIEELQYRQMP